ncbi:MAG: RNA methyltransferase, partial [Streptococcaceae bacterium]|nr:RNA methyltransferase [Streptococcaceae bacterium]
MKFPEFFYEKYASLLGRESEAFFASFNESAESGIRVNPMKNLEEFE